MLKVQFQLDELHCLHPITTSGDDVYVMFAGATSEGLRTVRVQPEKPIDGHYGWRLIRGQTLSSQVVLERALLDEQTSAQFCFALAARQGGTYQTALATSGQLADFFASPAGQTPISGLLFQLPDVLSAGDRMLGSFIVSMTNLGNNWTGIYSYGNHTQPPRRFSLKRLIQAAVSFANPLASLSDGFASGPKKTRYACRGNGGRYLISFSIESFVV